MNTAKIMSSLSPTLHEVASFPATFETPVGVRTRSTVTTFVPMTF
jgi:hypothetical protein